MTRTPNSRSTASSSLSPATPIDFNLHANFPEVLRGGFGLEPEASPIGRCRIVGRARGHDEAAIEQAFESFVDLYGREFTGKRADDGFSTFPCANPRGKRAVELAVKKDLPILRIEADDIGRQDIDREIWREPDLAVAVLL